MAEGDTTTPYYNDSFLNFLRYLRSRHPHWASRICVKVGTEEWDQIPPDARTLFDNGSDYKLLRVKPELEQLAAWLDEQPTYSGSGACYGSVPMDFSYARKSR